MTKTHARVSSFDCTEASLTVKYCLTTDSNLFTFIPDEQTVSSVTDCFHLRSLTAVFLVISFTILGSFTTVKVYKNANLLTCVHGWCTLQQ